MPFKQSVSVVVLQLADDVGGVVGIHLVEDGNGAVLAHLGNELGRLVGIHLGDDFRRALGVEVAQYLPLRVDVETAQKHGKRVRAGFLQHPAVELVELPGVRHHNEVVQRVAALGMRIQHVFIVGHTE